MNQDNQRQAFLYAYLAGIIDGEGTIRIEKSIRCKNHPNWKVGHCAAISVGNTCKELIVLLNKTFTPNCKLRKESILPSGKPYYRWATSGTFQVKKILNLLSPFLFIKKQQANLVLEFCNNKKNTKPNGHRGIPPEELCWREDFYQRVKKLNANRAAATTKQEDTER